MRRPLSFSVLLLLLTILQLQIELSISYQIFSAPNLTSNGIEYYSKEFVLTKSIPRRTFEINHSTNYLGILHVHVFHNDHSSQRGFETNWTNTPSMLFLGNRSEVGKDSRWMYFFANISNFRTSFEFSVSLKAGFTKAELTLVFYYNYYNTCKLTVEKPIFSTGSALQALNTTMVSFIGVLPQSTSNVSIHIKGGYIEDNKTYIISPNNWFTNRMKLRDREPEFQIIDNQTYVESPGGPHSDIILGLLNPNASAVVNYFHFPIGFDPDVNHNLDYIGLDPIMIMCLLLGTLSLLGFFKRHQRKIKY